MPSPRRPQTSTHKKRTRAKVTTTVTVDDLKFARDVAVRTARTLPAHIDLDDLIAAGVEGLLQASATYDPRRNVEPRTYARFRIRGAILDWLRQKDTLSRDMRRRSNLHRDTAHRLTVRLGREPNAQELASEMDISVDRFWQDQATLTGATVVGYDDEHDDFLAITPDPTAEDPEARALKAEKIRLLSAAIRRLGGQQARVLSLYYVEDLNLREIGLILNVTESRVCQIHTAAMDALRGLLAPS